jgi:hypothetical protein
MGAGGFGTAAGGFLTSTLNFTVFSDFVVGATPDPLPVELTAFNAQWDAAHQRVNLNWTTLWETNNAGFRIYRSEHPTQGFSLVQAYTTHPALVGAGTTLNASHYTSADDEGLQPGNTYFYRLEQVDYDGASRIAGSATVVIPVLAGAETVAAYPNPAAQGHATLALGLPDAGPVRATLLDIQGRTLATVVDAELPAGAHALPINTSQLPAGVYIYSVILPSGAQQTGRLVVQP